MTFGSYLRQRRELLRQEDRRFSVRQVAQRIGVEPAYLSKIERGDRFPSKELIKRIAQSFDIDERELLILYYSEKIANDLYREDFCTEVLEVAEQRIEYIRQKNTVQKKLF